MRKQVVVGTLAAIAVVAILLEAYSMGRTLHGAAKVEIDRVIAAENQDFCDRYRAVKAEATGNSCAGDLMELRRRHERRVSDIFYPGID